LATKRKVRISEALEKALLYGILRGVVPLEAVGSDELSKLGGIVHGSVSVLREANASAPYEINAILLAGSDVLGAGRDALKKYVDDIQKANIGVDPAYLVQKVRDKQTLLEVINEAGNQISKSTIDLSLLAGLLSSTSTTAAKPISEVIKDGLPEPPVGLKLRSLPILSRLTGGIIGMWAIAGEPGVGKSTFGWQVALDVGRSIPVLYYDFENGFSVLMDRTRELYKGDLNRIRAVTANIFYRDSIRTLDTDLGGIPAPALVIVDSVQKLPASVLNRRQGLDAWVHRLEGLKRRGYYVLLISEVGRAQYSQDAYIGSFKETGEIEYSVDVGVQLLPVSSTAVETNIVKNRHKPHKGSAGFLERVNGWWFKELSNDRTEVDLD